MKRNLLLVSLVIVMIAPVPAHAFFDYLFSGGGSRDAVGNSVLGDLRSWWTGNPAYTFNPFHSPNPLQNQGAQTPSSGQAYSPTGAAPQAGYQQYQQPNMRYYPPQGPAQYGQQGYPQAMPQAAQQPQQWVQQPIQQPVQQPVQPYQGMPPGYPQGYPR